jgi:hypothetical protein
VAYFPKLCILKTNSILHGNVCNDLTHLIVQWGEECRPFGTFTIGAKGRWPKQPLPRELKILDLTFADQHRWANTAGAKRSIRAWMGRHRYLIYGRKGSLVVTCVLTGDGQGLRFRRALFTLEEEITEARGTLDVTINVVK